MGTLQDFLLIMLIPTIMCQDFIFPDDDRFRQSNIPMLPSLALGAPSIMQRPAQPIPNKSPPTFQLNSNGLSDGISTLGLKINNELHIGQERSFTQDRPVIFSPLNIAEAMYMLLLGANGETYNELSKFLGITDLNNSQQWHEQFAQVLQSFEDPNPDSPKLTAATGLFVQEGFPIRNEYRDIVKRIYQSDINNLNFIRYREQAKNYINNWVNTRTNGKIQQILTEPPPVTTKLILTTALYFKGAWEQPFIQEATQKRPFYPYGRKNKTSVLVDMMANLGQFRYVKDKELNCEMIELPYKGGTTSMHIIVPTNSDREKLRTLEKRLTPDIINRLIEQSNISDSLIVLPKMRMESTIELSSILSDLGIQTLFDPSLSNLGVLSPGSRNEIPNNADTLLANRFGDEIKTNCSHFFEQNNILPNCIDQLPQPVNNYTKVIYKRFGSTIGRRFARHYLRRERSFSSVHKVNKRQTGRSIDDVRNSINQKSVNPGLYADEVLHKVYIDINESGTEAAAATDITVSKSLVRTVRLDHPFLFFIRHHESKMILFWGSINIPVPNYPAEK